MSTHHAATAPETPTNQPPAIERHSDVAIVGGSAAGLAAALQLGRQRRSVIVVDAGQPRNAPAASMHSFLGHEGIPPDELVAIGRNEVRSYGVEVLDGQATAIGHAADGGFQIDLSGGTRLVARRLLVATGIVDELPNIDGLSEHWGRDVIHCPFCHGYEVRDRRLVAIITHPMGLHPVPLLRQLSAELTLVLHDGVAADAPELESLRRAGIDIVTEGAVRVAADADGRVKAVETVGGTRIPADAILVGPRFRPRAELLTPLGLQPSPHASGLGDVIETDPSGETAIPGLYAAGNLCDPSLQVLPAAASGSWVGAMISFSLAAEDLATAQHRAGNEADWDQRYRGEPIWSGDPNQTLVDEITGLTPGRALDIGAGEGGDARWLAQQGWTVTATDVSTRALDHITALAGADGLAIECRHADATALDPFGGQTYDLVTAHYASIPRSPDGRAVANIAGAVAPGGTLLVVGHDTTASAPPIDPAEFTRPFDPGAFVGVADVAALVADSPEWDVEVNARRPRPDGTGHHAADIVLRARRRPLG